MVALMTCTSWSPHCIIVQLCRPVPGHNDESGKASSTRAVRSTRLRTQRSTHDSVGGQAVGSSPLSGTLLLLDNAASLVSAGSFACDLAQALRTLAIEC